MYVYVALKKSVTEAIKLLYICWGVEYDSYENHHQTEKLCEREKAGIETLNLHQKNETLNHLL